MLPLKYMTLYPMLKRHTRMIALHSGSEFGPLTDTTHLMERMDRHIEAMSDPVAWERMGQLSNQPYPTLGRERMEGDSEMRSDLILPDTFRQSRSIEEKYRKDQFSLHALRPLMDGATMYHRSIARGYERHLIDSYSQLDNEFINRSTIKPTL